MSVGLEYFPPMVMAFLRYGLSLIPLSIFVLRYHTFSELASILKDKWKLFVAVGLTAVTLPQLFQNHGMLMVSASAASILQATSPVFGVALGILLLRESATPNKIAGVSIALAGAVLLSMGDGAFSVGNGVFLGSFLIILSAFAYASSGFFMKIGLREHDPVTMTTLGIFVGTLFCIPFLFLPGEMAWFVAPTLGAAPLSIIIYLATLPTGLAMVLWFGALEKMELSRLMLFVYLIPVVATALSVAFFGEKVTPIMLASGALIISGVVLAQRK